MTAAPAGGVDAPELELEREPFVGPAVVHDDAPESDEARERRETQMRLFREQLAADAAADAAMEAAIVERFPAAAAPLAVLKAAAARPRPEPVIRTAAEWQRHWLELVAAATLELARLHRRAPFRIRLRLRLIGMARRGARRTRRATLRRAPARSPGREEPEPPRPLVEAAA